MGRGGHEDRATARRLGDEVLAEGTKEEARKVGWTRVRLASGKPREEGRAVAHNGAGCPAARWTSLWSRAAGGWG